MATAVMLPERIAGRPPASAPTQGLLRYLARPQQEPGDIRGLAQGHTARKPPGQIHSLCEGDPLSSNRRLPNTHTCARAHRHTQTQKQTTHVHADVDTDTHAHTHTDTDMRAHTHTEALSSMLD